MRFGIRTLTYVDSQARTHPFPRLSKWALYHASAVLFVPSSRDRERIVARLPGHADKVRINPIPSNIAVCHNPELAKIVARLRLSILNDCHVLCHFGLLSPGRRPELVLETAAVLRRRGQRVQTMIIGEFVPIQNDYHRLLQERCAALDLATAVTFTGRLPVDGVSALFQASDVFVLPHAEGASLKNATLMTALAHGIPAVITPGEPPPYELTHEREVLWAEPNADSLATQVQRIFADEPLRARLIACGRELAARCDWEHHVERLISAFSA